MKLKFRIYGICLLLASLLADIVTKEAILATTGSYQPQFISKVTDFFNLVLVWNPGVSFGMFSNDAEMMPYLLSGVALIIVIILGIWLFRTDRLLTALGLGLVMGGAIGNVIDRLRYGAVVDFLDFHVAGFHWPAFNIADATIFIGVVFLMIESIIEPKQKPNNPIETNKFHD